MIVAGNRLISIMVMYAVALHLCWAVLIAADSAAISATAVNALARFIHPPTMLSLVVGGAAAMAVYGMITRVPWVVVLLMPQQILLMMSAAGAVEAMWLSQFADGVIRPWAFIAADQLYSVLAAVGHTVAIAMHARRLVLRDG